MSERLRVTEVESLEPGDRTFVTTSEGEEIGVFNVDGEYFAIENCCLHEGGPVCHGSVRGVLEGVWPGPGERVRERYSDEPAIACPWHGWEYSLKTGEHVGQSSLKLPTYDVILEDDVIYLEV